MNDLHDTKGRNIAPFILSGGAGTRLWPVSRAGMAKQLVPVFGDSTLLQMTVERFPDTRDFDSPTVIGRFDDRFLIREQMNEIGCDASIVVEPQRRDTFAAVLLAAEIAIRNNPGAVVAVVPSDHLIPSSNDFSHVIRRAAASVRDAGIALVGVKPTTPSTAYGYIKSGDEVSDGVNKVDTFVEKPDLGTAKRLIEDSDYLWNAGVFCFNPGWLIDEIHKLDPATSDAVAESVVGATHDLNFIVPSERFGDARALSFDHGFLEQSDAALVVRASFEWSDVGDWKSVWASTKKDDNGFAAQGDVVNLGSTDCLVHATHKMVCTVGLKNVAVIETPDAVLVLSLDCAQDIKALVCELDKQGRSEASEHVRSYRPWGWYQTMDLGDRFRVKRICVKPGAKLSLQRHHHRAEHWVVVRGTAEVTVGDKTRKLHENESVYIPIGEVHRLANPGRIDLELVEVQSGTYLEEDDIERLDDVFGRVPKAIDRIAAE